MSNAFTLDAAASIGGPDWLAARRRDAAERFAAAALPTEAQEVWRFTNISSLDLDRYAPLTVPAAATGNPDAQAVVRDAVGSSSAFAIVRNGWVQNVEVDRDLASKGLVVSALAGAPSGAEMLALASHPADAFGELAAAFLPDAVVIDVPDGLVVPEPIVVFHWVDADGHGVFPRTIVRAGIQSELTVFDYYGGPDVASLVVPALDVHAGDASHIRYLTVQDLGRRVWQLAHQNTTVGRDANLTQAAVALGGDYARLRLDARLLGAGGTANLLAVYFGDGDQLHDFRTLQDHEGRQTTSDLLFKGAVVDQAHSVYTGMIRVQKGAVGTAAAQTNRNLVLAERARADSIPNLEILENNLRSCTHASATGPIDEEQRFYLEARGVPTQAADRMIVMGFFDDVLGRMPVPGVLRLLRLAVAEKLAKVFADA